MSYFDDYVAEGLCCECCGAFMGGDEPGYVRRCDACLRAEKKSESKPKRKKK